MHPWRHADDHRASDWRGEHPALGRYLGFLASTGYDLAPIERVAIGEDVDDIADDQDHDDGEQSPAGE